MPVYVVSHPSLGLTGRAIVTAPTPEAARAVVLAPGRQVDVVELLRAPEMPKRRKRATRGERHV